jgi:transcriptional activator of comK gene
MTKKILFPFLFLFIIGVAGCSNAGTSGEIQSVGLLVPETINDGVWGTKGYKGLLSIQSNYDVDVYYKEGIHTKQAVEQAIKEYKENDVNLIFGHGSEYNEFFNNVASKYPKTHFVSFNGEATEKNTTSLKFAGYAMGFFGGMTAAHYSKSDKIGVIAAYEWQPEVQGFLEGAKFENKDIEVRLEYTHSWGNQKVALNLLDSMIENNVDVVYPAGDGYNVSVIEKIKEEGLYAIGYVSDQSDLGESTVLTSTVQHADKLYEIVARKFSNGELPSGNINFDFQDGAISMGKFSPDISKDFKKEMEKHIETYMETGKLPNGKKSGSGSPSS